MKKDLLTANAAHQNHQQRPTQPKSYQLPKFVLDIIAFERVCTPPTALAIYTKSLARVSVVLHTFLGYLLLSQDSFSSSARQMITFFQTHSLVFRLLQISIYLANLVLLSVLLTSKQKQANKIKLSILKLMISNYFLLGTINMAVNSFLAYVNFEQSIPAILMASLIALFENIFFENYCLKSQLNYQRSALCSLLFKLGMISTFILNCIIVRYGTLQIFLYCSIILGALTLVWYLAVGYKQFFHRAPALIQIFFCAIIISLSAQFAIVVFKGSQTMDFVEWAIAFVLMSIYLMVYCKSKLLQFQPSSRHKNLKEYELRLHFLLEQANSDLEVENIIVGMLGNHSSRGCLSPKCKVMQCSKNGTFGMNPFVKDKDELITLYLKCLYQSALATEKTTETLIDYCEFMIAEFGNFSTHSFYLQKLILNPDNLGLFQKIKTNKLKLIMQEQADAFNKILFGGRVQFLQILSLDQHFDYIVQNIANYCTQSALIWKSALEKTINITDWKEQINSNFKLLPAIDQKWKQLSKYFYANKYWKFVYLNYAYYLKNQNVKNREFEKNDASNQGDDKFANRLKQAKDGLFFNDKAAVIQAKMQGGKMLLKKVNKNFEKLTFYSEEEIINMPLNTIQPYQIRPTHDMRVKGMIERGSSLTEDANHVLDTYFVTKQGNKVKAAVLFKLYISQITTDCIIHFFGMIVVIETNQKHVEQQGSQRLTQKLELQAPSQFNIFAKEELLQASQNYSQFTTIVRITRIVIIFVFGCIFLMFFLQNSQMGKAQTHIVQQQFMLAAYRFPMAIAINYIKLFLKIGDPALCISKINSLTTQLVQLSSDPTMISLLTDGSINVPARYPPYVVNSANKGLAYDQIDIFYVVYSSVVTLSGNSSINRLGPEYVRLDSYLKQYNRMTNATKVQLHNQFNQLIAETQSYQLWMMVAVVAIFLLTSLYLCYRVYFYYQKRNELVIIILQFDSAQTLNSLQYWRRIAATFRTLTSRDRDCAQVALTHSTLGFISNKDSAIEREACLPERMMERREPKISLNQRLKNIQVAPREKVQFRKLIIFLVLIIATIFMLNAAVPLFNMTQLNKIISFERAGFDIFRFVSFTGELSYAISRAYYYSLYPNQTALAPQLFSDTLATLQLMGQYQYAEIQQADSVFVQSRKNYLFGNPCTYNSTVLTANNASLQNCLTLANSSLTAGLSSFLRNVQAPVSSFINGKVKLPLSQVNSLSSILAISTYYFIDLGYTWLNELNQMIAAFTNEQLVLTLTAFCLSVVLYLVVLEYWFISKLERDYLLMKNIYTAYVPEAILLREKVVKQKFCQTGIIS